MPQLFADLDRVLEVGEADLLDVGDPLRAEGRVVLLAVVLPKRRGRVKSATLVSESIRSLIMSVLSTQYALREKVAQSLVPTGDGIRMLPLSRIMGALYHNSARAVDRQGARNIGNRLERLHLPMPRDFAAALRQDHGVAYETWRREYNRGATCRTIRDGNRWIYAEYDLEKARESVRTGKANMGTRMKLTVGMAILFRHFVLNCGAPPTMRAKVS